MNEKQWVDLVIKCLQPLVGESEPQLELSQGTQLPYAYEILRYRDKNEKQKPISQGSPTIVTRLDSVQGNP